MLLLLLFYLMTSLPAALTTEIKVGWITAMGPSYLTTYPEVVEMAVSDYQAEGNLRNVTFT